MRIRPTFLVLVGSVVVACGSRAGLLGSSGGAASDAGSVGPFAVGAEASSPADAGFPGDSGATVVADAPVETETMPPPADEADAGVTLTCVRIDLSTYDRNCNTDSDCMAITGGVICPVDCLGACPNAAINVSGRMRYTQSVAQLPPRSDIGCECGNLAGQLAFCNQRVCTYRP
jgi:hypothetical protein